MRSPEVQFSEEIEAYEQHLVCLVELELASGTLRYTSADIDLWYQGNRFTARGLQTDPIRYQLSGAVDKAVIVLDNVDGTLEGIIQNEEIRGKVATIYQAAVLPPAQVVALPLFTGPIDSVSQCNHKRGKLGVYGWTITARRKVPRRKHSHLCEVPVFKDEFCAYAGEETFCDRSYARCAALGNSLNFHGQRFLPAMMNKKLYWGRSGPK